jgi:hypothetical protein
MIRYLNSSGRGWVVCGCTVSGTGSSLLRSESAGWVSHAWLADVEAKTSDVDVAVTPDEESAEDRLSEDIENAIENSF